MKNIENILKSHNKELLHQHQNSETKVIGQCNCRSKNSCPLNGKCLTESLVYSAKIETPSENFTYIGMTEGSFKTRYNNHNASFRLPQYKSSTKLSEAVWSFKDNGTPTTSDGILSNAAHLIRMGTSIVTFAQLKKSK